MKSKYETKFSCAPVKKTGTKMYSVATPDTQLFAISTSKTTEASLNNLQNKKNTTLRTLSMPKRTLLKRLYQFVATVNVYLGTTK